MKMKIIFGTIKYFYFPKISVFHAEVIFAGVSRVALGAGSPDLVHGLPGVVPSHGVVTDGQRLVGLEGPDLLLEMVCEE